MQKLATIFSYLKYLITAQTKHDVHSPFVFDLITNVIETEKDYYAFRDIDSLRASLLLNENKIERKELGAGSSITKSTQLKISTIANNAAKSKKYGELLFKLVDYYQPKTILELGTSLGVSTAYLASANTQAKVATIEGCQNTAKVAAENFAKLYLKNTQLSIGNFDDVLKPTLEKLQRVDFVFFDGNHRKEPTLNYFETCLPYTTNETIFVFDDINWSKEMQEAWTRIKEHPKVKVTVDLFFIGIVFFREELSKEDFVIRF